VKTITVTTDDIKQGVAGDCARCPVAIALNRAFMEKGQSAFIYSPEARVVEIDWELHLEVWGRYIQAPDSVDTFVRRFDGHAQEPATPISFVLPEFHTQWWKEKCTDCEELFGATELDGEGICEVCAEYRRKTK
jgi:hypothetical protein